jgi:hypothetical protein
LPLGPSWLDSEGIVIGKVEYIAGSWDVFFKPSRSWNTVNKEVNNLIITARVRCSDVVSYPEAN